MAEKKYQIFVSSTFRDLAEERQDAIRSILDLGHIPAGMELFPASDTEQLTYIKKIIDECDYYILILGGRYGSIDQEGVSYTEREYDYAVDSGKTVLAFVHGDTSQISVAKSDTSPRLQENLINFRAKVMNGRLVREWTNRENLEPLVLKAIIRAIADYPAIGWIRANHPPSSETLQQLNDLLIENESLKTRLSSADEQLKPKIIGIAQLEDSVDIHFSRRVHSTGRYATYQTEDTHRKLTWSQIFSGIGNSLKSPGTTQTLKNAINGYIENTFKLSSVFVKNNSAEMIENHLVALGLLRSYNANSVSGGLHAYLSLTEKGRMTLLECLAVRASQ